MALPGGITAISTDQITTTIYGLPASGQLVYKYSPFQNLKIDNPIPGEINLTDLRLNALQAGLNIDSPLVLDIEEAYDGSANLIISDKENPMKLVNSRFYLTDSSHYVVADRRGNFDTNIYTTEEFKTQASLVKTARSIITLKFLEVANGGRLPVGNYNFYFKLADFDGNETDFVSESGQVICYIGTVNDPISIRGGQLNENSEKMVKFELGNLDMAYDFINVYYTRNTGDELTENLTVHKVNNKFRITGETTKITITGYEETESITLADLNTRYVTFDKVKTAASCQNMIFAGNINNNYELFATLEKYSLFIKPYAIFEEDIGNLDNNYTDLNTNNNEYFNPSNIYYRLSYWDEEIYRFGIVYIMNDYTLSPVFNTRGKDVIGLFNDTTYSPLQVDDYIESTEDYSLLYQGSSTTYNENIKGVFRINVGDTTNKMFNQNNPIKPIGVEFRFDPELFDETVSPKITEITRGFFIVRQKRIPTILAQGISMGTTKKGYIPTINTASGYILESFLTRMSQQDDAPKLGRSLYTLEADKVNSNALLCPEASIRKSIFNSLFNSSNFYIKKWKYQPAKAYFIDLEPPTVYNLMNQSRLYGTDNMNYNTAGTTLEKKTELLLVDSETNLINNKNAYFSSVAGNAYEAWKHVDPRNGDIEDVTIVSTEDQVYDKQLSISTEKTRGVFNSYVATTVTNLDPASYYNIYNKDYSLDKMPDYFKIRFNDSSPFLPVSDRFSWTALGDGRKLTCYRGDCYISTYAHRMMWNFTDPELPTNHKIIDPFTWYKNYKVKTTKIKVKKDFVIEDNVTGTGEMIGQDSYFLYRKVLNTFTYKTGELVNDIDPGVNLESIKLMLPETKRYKKYAESNGEFGASKINRGDVNAVGLGHWVVFKVCSNINLSLRDEDFSYPAEEAIHKRKRSFYPYSSADITNCLPESHIINKGISQTLGNRYYFEIPEVPFIQTHFSNRIHYSNLLLDSVFKDGSRVFEAGNYQDYTLEYGQLTRLVEWYGTLIAVMEHGVIMIPVNERAMMANASGENVYINTETVLPKNPKVLSNTFGSIWHDAIVKTPRYIYGLDTIGKKVWRTNGDQFELISDMKIQKFINDNITLKVTDTENDIVFHLVKAHYNAFKHDVIFVFKYALEKWVLCWNEISNVWVTRYTWFPEFSENINNIFYTFANKIEHPNQEGKLFKHGWAGTYEEQGYIKPTLWYETQYGFEFEFVVLGVQGVQKIFDNLKIVSNKAEPYSFTYEIVGEGYDWYKYKEVISWMETNGYFNTGFGTEGVDFLYNEDGYYSILEGPASDYTTAYTFLLTATMSEIEDGCTVSIGGVPTTFPAFPDFPRPYGMGDDDKFMKLPYVPKTKLLPVSDTIDWDTVGYETALIQDRWGGEDRILSYQPNKPMNKHGRIRGNSQYVEDSWDIQVQPLKIRYAFLKNDVLEFTDYASMKIRDKYLKIRVKYSGQKLAIVSALRTLFTISYS